MPPKVLFNLLGKSPVNGGMHFLRKCKVFLKDAKITP